MPTIQDLLNPFGARVYALTAYGAKPDDATVDSSGRTSVDRAVDLIRADWAANLPEGATPSATIPATVYIPAGKWRHNDPVLFDRQNVTLLGAGQNATVLQPVANRAITGIQLGLRTAPAGLGYATTLTPATTPGSRTVTVAAIAGLSEGCPVIVDSGGNAETVIATGVTVAAGGQGSTATFTAEFTKSHASGVAAIVGRDKPQPLTPWHWVDLSGKLDSSMVGSSGTRWGYRTCGDSHLTFHSSPWNAGNYDYFASTTAITLDFCLDGRGFTVGGGSCDSIGPACSSYGPQPFHALLRTNNVVEFRLRTTDMLAPTLAYRYFRVQVPTGLTGIIRFAAQIDLIAQTFAAFAGATATGVVQLPIVASGVFGIAAGEVGQPWAVAGNVWASAGTLAFRPCLYQPFNVGSFSVTSGGGAADGQALAPGDISIYGLKLSKGLRYQSNGTGTTQVATAQVSRSGGTVTVAGAAVNDRYRYGDDNSASMLACLPMINPPIGHANCRYGGRMVYWRSNGNTGGGLFMSTNAHMSVNAWVYDPAVKDLAVLSPYPWGDGIGVGSVGRTVAIQNVTTDGFFRGIGGMGMGSSYPIEVTGTNRLDNAFDAAYFGDSQIVSKLEFTSNTMGTTGLRIRGSQLKASNMYFGGQSTYGSFRPAGVKSIMHLIRQHAGGYANSYCYTFDYDGEDGNITTQVECDCGPTDTTVLLLNCKLALQPVGAAVVLHDHNDAGVSAKPMNFSARDTTFAGYSPIIVQVDGPMVRGEWQGGLVPPTSNSNFPLIRHVVYLGTDGLCNVRWLFPLGAWPDSGPADGQWVAGTFVMPLRSGQALHCTTSGTAGAGAVFTARG